jgi:hypothetical protein
MKNTESVKMALEWATTKGKHLGNGTSARKEIKAFTAGIEALMGILDSESERLVRVLEKFGTSEFEKGQIDGICWLLDAVKIKMGQL